MKIGQTGTYVVAMDQVTINGTPCHDDISYQSKCEDFIPQLGDGWSWSGSAVRLDGPCNALLLEKPIGQGMLHRHARKRIQRRRFVEESHGFGALDTTDQDFKRGFMISDGTSKFILVPIGHGRECGLWCATGLPEAERSYTVTRLPTRARISPSQPAQTDAVISFTQGTRITTATGTRAVEDLRPGDKVMTRDDGLQKVMWIGQRTMSGAKLHAMPELRPVCIRAGAIGRGTHRAKLPQTDLLVSPHHRLLMSSGTAESLFGQREVAITAKDLIDGVSVVTDDSLREVQYYHLLLPRRAVLWANGMPSESHHPADGMLDTVEELQRERLLSLLPDDDLFGRRSLTGSEVEILMRSNT